MTVVSGLIVTMVIAGLSMGIVALLPVDFVGATVVALFIGMLVGNLWTLPEQVKPGVQFAAKRLLKVFIILLGASMNMALIAEVGVQALILLAFTIGTAFIAGKLLGKFLELAVNCQHCYQQVWRFVGVQQLVPYRPLSKRKKKRQLMLFQLFFYSIWS